MRYELAVLGKTLFRCRHVASLGTFGSALAVPGLATQRDRAGRAHPVTDVLLMLLR